MKENNKTLIRWVCSVIMVFIVFVSLIVINYKPYEVKISIEANEKLEKTFEQLKEIEELRLINTDSFFKEASFTVGNLKIDDTFWKGTNYCYNEDVFPRVVEIEKNKARLVVS